MWFFSNYHSQKLHLALNLVLLQEGGVLHLFCWFCPPLGLSETRSWLQTWPGSRTFEMWNGWRRPECVFAGCNQPHANPFSTRLGQIYLSRNFGRYCPLNFVFHGQLVVIGYPTIIITSTVVSFQSERFSSKCALSFLPPSSLRYEERRKQGRQLSFWWKALNLMGHYSSLLSVDVGYVRQLKFTW